MEHTKHIWRAIIILAIGMIGFVVARNFMVPESFGKEGHFRFDSVGEYMAKPVVHQGNKFCMKCHEEQYEEHGSGKHAAVPCETCHGPAAPHADKKDKLADAYVDKSYNLCALCHQELAARPDDFPQIVFLDHINERLAEEELKPVDKLSRKICGLCHPSHDPRQED